VLVAEPRAPVLWALGVLLGLALYHASFGFAGAYRRMFVELAGGTFGQDIGGASEPLGVSVAIGTFLFGIGMQLAGGCGSGTL